MLFNAVLLLDYEVHSENLITITIRLFLHMLQVYKKNCGDLSAFVIEIDVIVFIVFYVISRDLCHRRCDSEK